MTEQLMKEAAKIVKKHRLKAGLSERDYAKLADISRGTLRVIEKGGKADEESYQKVLDFAGYKVESKIIPK